MKTFTRAWVLFLVVVFAGTGCYTQIPQLERPSSYTYGENYFYGFSTADELARWLRVDSGAGVLVSAHRGGPAPGFPENAVPTFDRTLSFGPAIIECDVRMTQDSVLVLMHDETIDRTTTGSGRVDNQTLSELRRVRLVDDWGYPTWHGINTVSEALGWAEDRAVLTLDIKEGVPAEAVVNLLERHNAARYATVIVYNLQDLIRYHELMPELVISASASSVEEAQEIIDSGVDLSRLMVFTGVGEARPDVNELLRAHNIRPILGTFGEIDRRAVRKGSGAFVGYIEQGVDIIATDVPEIALDAARRHDQAPLPNAFTVLQE